MFFPLWNRRIGWKDKIGDRTKKENNNICIIMLFQRQNLLENIFPAQWKTEFQSYFSQYLLESARKKKKKKKKTIIYILFFFFFFFFFQRLWMILKYKKIKNFPAAGINKTLFILFVLFILFNHDLRMFAGYNYLFKLFFLHLFFASKIYNKTFSTKIAIG